MSCHKRYNTKNSEWAVIFVVRIWFYMKYYLRKTKLSPLKSIIIIMYCTKNTSNMYIDTIDMTHIDARVICVFMKYVIAITAIKISWPGHLHTFFICLSIGKCKSLCYDLIDAWHISWGGKKSTHWICQNTYSVNIVSLIIHNVFIILRFQLLLQARS